jgi:hypothetical protein
VGDQDWIGAVQAAGLEKAFDEFPNDVQAAAARAKGLTEAVALAFARMPAAHAILNADEERR